jgi:hypothetical protein
VRSSSNNKKNKRNATAKANGKPRFGSSHKGGGKRRSPSYIAHQKERQLRRAKARLLVRMANMKTEHERAKTRYLFDTAKVIFTPPLNNTDMAQYKTKEYEDEGVVIQKKTRFLGKYVCAL